MTSFSFFEHEGEHAEHEHGTRAFYANVTPTLRRLQAAGLYSMGDPLETTLVTVPIVPGAQAEDVAVPFEGVAISVDD